MTYRDNPPQTISQLRHRLVQEWQNIPQATIRVLGPCENAVRSV